jgi:hypothetical protein
MVCGIREIPHAFRSPDGAGQLFPDTNRIALNRACDADGTHCAAFLSACGNPGDAGTDNRTRGSAFDRIRGNAFEPDVDIAVAMGHRLHGHRDTLACALVTVARAVARRYGHAARCAHPRKILPHGWSQAL